MSKILSGQAEADGVAEVYDLVNKKVIRRHPVDVREMISVGVGSLEVPDGNEEIKTKTETNPKNTGVDGTSGKSGSTGKVSR